MVEGLGFGLEGRVDFHWTYGYGFTCYHYISTSSSVFRVVLCLTF